MVHSEKYEENMFKYEEILRTRRKILCTYQEHHMLKVKRKLQKHRCDF